LLPQTETKILILDDGNANNSLKLKNACNVDE